MQMGTTILIRSKWYPRGRLYRLVDVEELDAESLAELVRLNRRAEEIARRETVLRRLRMGRVVDAAVRLLMPDLEPRVLRQMPLESRLRILTAWTEAP